MNIFYLDTKPDVCAEHHCDKHVVKMILEYAQLLSTAHRVLDGTESVGISKTGRKQTRFVLPDHRESVLYSATHINHPSAAWVRQSKDHYIYLHRLLTYTCAEYTKRYGKVHKVQRDDIMSTLYIPPVALDNKRGFVEPPPAMPDYCKVAGDSVASYRNYYIKEKSRFATWKTKAPQWYVEGVST